MNVEYINPFIEASQQVIQMMTGIKPTLGKVHLKNSPYPSDSVAVIVGLTGKLRGQVIISLNIETAMSIASIMMGGMPIEKFDDMPKSAISELGNMIMGNTATILFTKGIGIEITPPSLLMGEKITVSQSSMKTICVPLNLGNDGKVTIDISLEKN
ncbi:MAG: chemotaxis protein CheX [Bacillota bacterium]|jgi:chemotaxis protein CheX|nr:chemotaxis protein CheX [Bacillota bacterium]NLV62464.1 chemotaxis protein CheX [Clostridiaceae bacterium]